MWSEAGDAGAGYASVGAGRYRAGARVVWEETLTPVEAIEQPYKKRMECAKT